MERMLCIYDFAFCLSVIATDEALGITAFGVCKVVM